MTSSGDSLSFGLSSGGTLKRDDKKRHDAFTRDHSDLASALDLFRHSPDHAFQVQRLTIGLNALLDVTVLEVLACLPNLTALHLLRLQSQEFPLITAAISSQLLTSLKQNTFPSLQSLTIENIIAPLPEILFLSCPHLESLTLIHARFADVLPFTANTTRPSFGPGLRRNVEADGSATSGQVSRSHVYLGVSSSEVLESKLSSILPALQHENHNLSLESLSLCGDRFAQYFEESTALGRVLRQWNFNITSLTLSYFRIHDLSDFHSLIHTKFGSTLKHLTLNIRLHFSSENSIHTNCAQCHIPRSITGFPVLESLSLFLARELSLDSWADHMQALATEVQAISGSHPLQHIRIRIRVRHDLFCREPIPRLYSELDDPLADAVGSTLPNLKGVNVFLDFEEAADSTREQDAFNRLKVETFPKLSEKGLLFFQSF
ncbi:hypothetical protein DL96DRAFT_1702053 [Flagelloscypha sp. PMI_526]|nr:hypothetical protein DL96DRAFT_1702053 [Flagelloscypha sp. PMI_526]